MANEQWHLDKRVPVAIIFAILIQSAGGVWWASAMNERMSQVERRLEGFASRSQETERQVDQQGREIGVLTTEIKNLTRQLERLYAQGEATNALLRQVLSNEARR